MIVIRTVEIRNFRSIVILSKKIVGNHLNIIVGQNDIGKSNFLKAISLLYEGVVGKNGFEKLRCSSSLCLCLHDGNDARYSSSLEQKSP